LQNKKNRPLEMLALELLGFPALDYQHLSLG
jgi:hypothetical protein